MPAKSQVQQIAMAIAKHSPEKLYKRNRGLAEMSQQQLGEFASTARNKLVKRVAQRKGEQK